MSVHAWAATLPGQSREESREESTGTEEPIWIQCQCGERHDSAGRLACCMWPDMAVSGSGRFGVIGKRTVTLHRSQRLACVDAREHGGAVVEMLTQFAAAVVLTRRGT